MKGENIMGFDLGNVIDSITAKDKWKYIEQIMKQNRYQYLIEVTHPKKHKMSLLLIEHLGDLYGASTYFWEDATYTFDFDIKKFVDCYDDVGVKLNSITDIINLPDLAKKWRERGML